MLNLQCCNGIMCGAAGQNHFEFMKYVYDICKIIIVLSRVKK
jgi:hypothetical protein